LEQGERRRGGEEERRRRGERKREKVAEGKVRGSSGARL